MNKPIALLFLLISATAYAQIYGPDSSTGGGQVLGANSSGTPTSGGGPAIVNVIAYGADPSGTGNSTSAFQSAIAASSYVYIPCGTYKLNLTISSKSNFTLDGSSCSILKPYNTANDVIDLVGGSFSTYKGFAVHGTGSGSGSGIVISRGAGNIKLLNLNIQGFPRYGVACTGTSESQMSGNDFRDSDSLYNGTANLYWTYCNDFQITGSQFGGLGTTPTWGVAIVDSNAGQLKGNYIWSNGIGIEADSAYYDWINENRITQSAKQGLICSACGNSNIQNNQFYQNSNSSIGAYESTKFTGSRDIPFEGNQFFDWTGIAHTDYSLTIDSTSSNFTITGNEFEDSVSPTNTIAPTNISSAATRILQDDNTPTQTAYVNNCAPPRHP